MSDAGCGEHDVSVDYSPGMEEIRKDTSSDSEEANVMRNAIGRYTTRKDVMEKGSERW